MQTRHQGRNLPTELLRALVTIAETGSVTKAAVRLQLSQPAVTAQMRRLQVLTGIELFSKTSGGLEFSDQGRLVLDLARKMLAANDQILSLTGASGGAAQPIRIGISNVYVERFLQIYSASGEIAHVHIHADSSFEVAKAFREGQVDVLCSFEPLSSDHPIEEWHQAFDWVHAPGFVLRPGEPVPVVTRPGGFLSRLIMDSLDAMGQRYRIVFASPDFAARKAAVAAGLGVMAIPAGFVEPNLVKAADRMLPALTPVRAGICLRKGVAPAEIRSILDALRSLEPTAAGKEELPTGTRGRSATPSSPPDKPA
jgi:DNA-binding transcriptional LysR family regulator